MWGSGGMVDTLRLERGAVRREGSNPSFLTRSMKQRTDILKEKLR